MYHEGGLRSKPSLRHPRAKLYPFLPDSNDASGREAVGLFKSSERAFEVKKETLPALPAVLSW
jgi:hypothetical protein